MILSRMFPSPKSPPQRHQKSFRRLTARDRQEIFSGDIRSSTRLTGYVMGGIGCLVVSVSAILFKQYRPDYRGSIVIPWKVDAAIAFSIVGLIVFLTIVLGHFDTWFYQKMWSRVFKNGSLVERNIIYSLMIYWIFGLWICTSMGSPGMNQTNVLISSWIVLAAIVVVFLEWRDAAGRFSITKWSQSGSRIKSQLVLLVIIASFGLIFSLDTYIYKRVVRSVPLDESYVTLIWVMSLNAASVAASCFLIVLNETVFRKYRLLWKWFEGAILLAALCLWGYVMFSSSVGCQECSYWPTNLYFLSWGAFLLVVSAFGTCLHDIRGDIA